MFYEEPNQTLYCGHALEVLREMPSESVDMVMTSPPYWGLRTYKTEPQIWGDNHCEHQWTTEEFKQHSGRGDCQSSKKYSEQEPVPDMVLKRDFCLKCNAWRGELGLEPTIELYISHLILIFNEVKRVLKKTGTCWVNIDDSYASGKGTCFNPGGGKGSFSGHGDRKDAGAYPLDRGNVAMLKAEGLLPKSLCLIPQRFAIAMVEQGWILRNDIVWNKPNPMPESVKDRFTGSWEHLFFFVKSSTIQYWTNPITGRITDKQPLGTKGKFGEDWVYRKVSGYDDGCGDDGRVRKRVSLWQGHTYFFEQQFDEYTEPLNRWGGDEMRRSSHKYIDSFEEDGFNGGIGKIGATSMFREGRPVRPNELGRNKRDVWEITTQPYPEAHFATFPEKLCEIPILAGCPSAICKKCGKAREKVYEFETIWRERPNEHVSYQGETLYGQPNQKKAGARPIDKGYTDCGCNADFEPGVVLDLFCGSGTILAVAKKLGRKGIGIDLSSKYCDLTVKRLQGIPLPMELI